MAHSLIRSEEKNSSAIQLIQRLELGSDADVYVQKKSHEILMIV